MAKEDKKLNKPFRLPSGSSKKFGVYVKNDKGNTVKVTFGDPNMEIRRDDPEARKNFRARHNCSNPGPKWKARYWSCWQWRASSPVKGELGEPCCDDCASQAKKKKPGLWENIRKKKERLGRDYSPAKPGDPDRPSKEALKRSQNKLDEFTKREIFKGKKKRKYSKNAFLELAAKNFNPFRGPQKPTDGDEDKKKKKRRNKNGY